MLMPVFHMIVTITNATYKKCLLIVISEHRDSNDDKQTFAMAAITMIATTTMIGDCYISRDHNNC